MSHRSSGNRQPAITHSARTLGTSVNPNPDVATTLLGRYHTHHELLIGTYCQPTLSHPFNDHNINTNPLSNPLTHPTKHPTNKPY